MPLVFFILWFLVSYGLASEVNVLSSTNGNIKQSLYQCVNGSQVKDECQCKELETLCRLQPCLTGKESIQRRYMCDGKFDCKDLSDECLCDRRTSENMATYDICAQIFTDSENPAECPLGCASCEPNYGGVTMDRSGCVKTSEICDEKVQCRDVSDEAFCLNKNDAIVDYLKDVNLEFNVNIKQYFSCENRTIFSMNTTQDGEAFGADPGYHNGRWLRIDWRRRFDGIADCEDISDEWHRNFVYCGDNGTDLVITRCPETFEGDRTFATPEHLIESDLFYVLEWSIGISALVGNTILAVYSLLAIFRRKDYHNNSEEGNNASSNKLSATGGKVINHIQVLFLCMSDLIMAVQIIMMTAANEHFRGNYWQHDEVWQSSLTCVVIGSLAVFSTQASAFMIVAISFVRLYVVSKPFKTIKTKYVCWTAISTYAVAALLMFIPMMTFVAPFEKYFIHSAYAPNHPQVDATVLERDKIEDYVRKIVILHSSSDVVNYAELRWGELENIVHEINPQFAKWLYFGYYSQISICIPPIVAHWTDPGLIYSFSILVVDFAAFSLVFIAYSVVYRTTKTRGTRSGCIVGVGCCSGPIPHRSSSQLNVEYTRPPSMKRGRRKSLIRDVEDYEMQKRILWIIGTDFVCWSPICILTLVAIINPNVKDPNTTMAAMILVQINSVINPLVYSKRIRYGLKYAVQRSCRELYNLISKLLKRKNSVSESSSTSASENGVIPPQDAIQSFGTEERATQTDDYDVSKQGSSARSTNLILSDVL